MAFNPASSIQHPTSLITQQSMASAVSAASAAFQSPLLLCPSICLTPTTGAAPGNQRTPTRKLSVEVPALIPLWQGGWSPHTWTPLGDLIWHHAPLTLKTVHVSSVRSMLNGLMNYQGHRNWPHWRVRIRCLELIAAAHPNPGTQQRLLPCTRPSWGQLASSPNRTPPPLSPRIPPQLPLGTAGMNFKPFLMVTPQHKN